MIRDILGLSAIYNLFSKTISKNNDALNRFYKHNQGDRILDIGCGPGSLSHHFLDATYTGFDLSQEYIDKAKQKFKDYPNLTFHCADVGDFFVHNEIKSDDEKYNLIFMSGVIHHLTDEQTKSCLSAASKVLKRNGRFISIDGVYTNPQSSVAKLLLQYDRGKYVRSEQEYVQLIEPYFPDAKHEIYTDVLRIPYSHIIFW